MKKTLIILLLLAMAIWLLVLPGLVGLSVQRAVPGWLEETLAEDQWQLERGWFSSRLAIALDHDQQLTFQARHLPPIQAAWLRTTGGGRLCEWLPELNIDGQIGLTGQTRLTATGPTIQWPAGPVAFHSGATALTLDLAPGQAAHLVAGSAGLNARGREAVEWAADYGQLNLDWTTDEGFGQLALRLEFNDTQPAESALWLDLAIRSIELEALGLLADAYEQLRLAPPDSISERLALLSLLGAWQQLVQAGLTIEIQDARLGELLQLEGRWNGQRDQGEITGGGQLETLLLGLAPYVALASQSAIAEAEETIMGWVIELTERGWLHSDGQYFVLNYRGSGLLESVSDTLDEPAASDSSSGD